MVIACIPIIEKNSMSNYLKEAKQVGEVFSSTIMTFDQPYNYCTKIKDDISGYIDCVVYFDKYTQVVILEVGLTRIQL